MNLNDPFGRIQSKRQKEYQSLRQSLQKMGINTPADARELLEKLYRRGIWGVAVIAPVTLFLMVALPELRFFVLGCGVLAGFLWIKTSLRSREYVKRYMREDLGVPEASSNDTPGASQ